MVMIPQIYTATVMHKRLFPKVNFFSYRVYYFAVPLPAQIKTGRLVRFDAKDVGLRDGSDPESWARNILAKYGLNDICQSIILVTMPRVLGYVFNPVSFYLCCDGDKNLRTVLCEVHNTFGEQHFYVCAHADGAPIEGDQWLCATKIFHVSPFLPRQGRYKFRFSFDAENLSIWIDYLNDAQQKQLVTSLVGRFLPLTSPNLRRVFWQHPMVTLKTIWLIHWQALRLVMRGISYRHKPRQLPDKISATHEFLSGK
ncbi:MAG: DUF1365 domain-containing protein [Candidatus Symbiobacter sp.]|nr:DUF1365 domain-containing protein [Candidatus Symbiobacter sp.]